MEDTLKELEILTSIPAVSGHEDKIIGYIYDRIKQLVDDVNVDRVGNLVCTFRGKPSDGSSLIVFAHVDEIGLIVRKIEENGFLRFERIGGIPEKTLLGQVVDVYSIDGEKSFTGVIGAISHHLTSSEKKFTVPSRLEMYIDMGLNSREEVLERGIDVGSIITYHPNFHRISERRFTSKALDNRIGVYLLLKLAEHLRENPPSSTVHVVFSVQEEFNVRGVLPVFEKIKPHAAICLDITPACDTPDLQGLYSIELGRGPAITQMNFHGRGTLGGIIPNPKLRRFIESTAEELKIPYQREVVIGVITDDAFSPFTGHEGVAATHISVPIRYSHSPIETADLQDVEATFKLLTEVVDRFNKNVDLKRGLF